MKSISASIVILAASVLILGGSWIPHSDTQMFVQAAGCVFGALGFWGWLGCMKEK